MSIKLETANGSVDIVGEDGTGGVVVQIPRDVLTSLRDFDVSLGTNGYQKLPNGLIIQWGYDTQALADGTTTFPLAFPNACINVLNTSTSIDWVTSKNLLTTSYDWNRRLNDGTYATDTAPHYWVAIGY